jgi:uncharacterized protein (TIGR02453 family)
MFDKDIFVFLKDLKKNNNREWFTANKASYLNARKSFEDFVLQLIGIVKSVDPEVGSPDPKDCIFRIYRDVRFSTDKSPYKTNFGAFISKGGKKLSYAGYYFHIEPGEIFISGGVYMPPNNILKAIREAIFDEPELFRKIIGNPGFKKYFPELGGEKLKSSPQGYPKDHPDIDLLRYKNYYVWWEMDEKFLNSPQFEDELRKSVIQLKKLNDFLNKAIDHSINGL